VQNILCAVSHTKYKHYNIYGNLIRSAFVCGRQHRLRLLENRVLRETVGSKGEGVTGGVNKLFSSEYQNKKDNKHGLGWAYGMCGGHTKCTGGFDV